MPELISVVVPIYNVIPYLRRCVDSIRGQSYPHLEVILVDDGSTDGSSRLCDTLAAEDSRICVVHKTNGGLSDARNAGLDAASGDCIVFWDSDDWTESGILDEALKVLHSTGSELVVWGYSVDFVDDYERLVRREDVRLPNVVCERCGDNSFLLEPKVLGAVGYAWNKLYRRGFLERNRLRFEKGTSLVEDILFNEQAFCHALKVAFIGCIGNHYVQRRRPTLGVAYYEDAFNLKWRAIQARRRILATYSVSAAKTDSIIQRQLFTGLKSCVRMMACTDALDAPARRAALKSLLDDPRAHQILRDCTGPTDLKDRVFRFVFRHKYASILGFLGGL